MENYEEDSVTQEAVNPKLIILMAHRMSKPPRINMTMPMNNLIHFFWVSFHSCILLVLKPKKTKNNMTNNGRTKMKLYNTNNQKTFIENPIFANRVVIAR